MFIVTSPAELSSTLTNSLPSFTSRFSWLTFTITPPFSTPAIFTPVPDTTVLLLSLVNESWRVTLIVLFFAPATSTPVPAVAPNVVVTVAILVPESVPVPPVILIPVAPAFTVEIIPVVILRVLVAWFDIVASIPVALLPSPFPVTDISPVIILASASLVPPAYLIPVPAVALLAKVIAVFLSVTFPVPAILIPVPAPFSSIVPSVIVVFDVLAVPAILIPILSPASATSISPAATSAFPSPLTDIPIPFVTVIFPLFVRVVVLLVASVTANIPMAVLASPVSAFTVIPALSPEFLFTAVAPAPATIPSA